MADYTAAIDKLASAGHEVDWYGPADEQVIEIVERALGHRLPDSYREFLLEFGGGGVDGAEISGIWPGDPLDRVRGSVYSDTLTCREEYGISEDMIVINFEEAVSAWALDTSRMQQGECPVVNYGFRSQKAEGVLAPTFSQFFQEYLEGWADEPLV